MHKARPHEENFEPWCLCGKKSDKRIAKFGAPLSQAFSRKKNIKKRNNQQK